MPTETPPATVIPANGARVTGGVDTSRLARALAGPLTAALDALGEVEVAEIQWSISEPVAVTIGPEGGEQVERSKPGEPPRMDYGVLVRHVEHHIDPGSGNGLPTLVISSSRPPGDAASGRGSSDDPDAPFILEFELDRPYMLPALVRLKGYARDFIAKFFESK